MMPTLPDTEALNVKGPRCKGAKVRRCEGAQSIETSILAVD